MALDPTYLATFKADLHTLSAVELFTRYVATDTCRGLAGVDHEALREQIAGHFHIPQADVMIVGSAKIGFTLRDKKAKKGSDEPDRPRFSEFSENSDVDVAIVSDRLFDEIWKASFEFWHTSGYGNAGAYWSTGKDFRDYFFRGWMRPDKLPSEGSFRYRSDWFDFFRRLTSARAAGDYKITGGLYRESYFLQAYQTIAINQCRASA